MANAMRFSADLTGTQLNNGDAVAVRMTGDSGREISADIQPDGGIQSSIRAQPRPNETNVPEVARIFRERRNKEGATFGRNRRYALERPRRKSAALTSSCVPA